MLFKTLNINNKEYKLRLSTRVLIQLERELGESPVDLLMEMSMNGQQQKMPKLEPLIKIFHASLQKFHHGISLDDTFDLYDDYVDEGNTIMEFLMVVMDIFKVSGFFRDEDINTAQGQVEGK